MHIHIVIPSFPPTSLLTPLCTLLTMPLPITLSVRTTVFLYLLLYTYSSILTLLYLLFYAYFSTCVTDFTFSNHIGTMYMYIYSIAYVVNHVFSDYIVTTSTLPLTLSAMFFPITYLLYLLFRLRRQLCHIYSSACLVSCVSADYIITISITVFPLIL